MFIQKKASPIFLALLCMVPVSAMAATQVLSTYKNAPNPTILANLGVPADSQMAQQALARQIAVQAAAMQQTNPALVGSVITGDTASVPYNGYQASSLKTGFGYQQPTNGDVLFADLINVLPTAASATPLSTSAPAAATNDSAALQAQITALQNQLTQAKTQASNSSGGVNYSSTAANALVQSLSTNGGYKGSTATLPNGMTVSSNVPFGGGTTTYSITYGSGSQGNGGYPPFSSGLTASQAAAILQGGSAAANALVQSLSTNGNYKDSTATLPNGMTVSSNVPFGGGTTTYSITYGSGSQGNGGYPPFSSGLTASQAAAILQGGSAAANALVQSLSTNGNYKDSTATLPNGMTVSSNVPFGGGTTTYSITYGSGSQGNGGYPPSSTGLTASQAAAILASSITGIGSVSSSSSAVGFR
ncbi:MAG: hypothetical protein PHX24_02080 [Acidithiobacillus sp.]|nr:hypothetical protein [Acidithiobacillus sp.]